MWAVYDLSAKWRALVRRKEKRTEVYQQALTRCESWMTAEDSAGLKLQELHEAIDSCISQTAEAESMEVRYVCCWHPLPLIYPRLVCLGRHAQQAFEMNVKLL